MSQHGVKLSVAQKKALAKAAATGKGYKLKLSKNALVGGEMLTFSNPQITKIASAHRRGVPAEIALTKAQISKMAQQGGGLWDDFKTVAKKVGKALKPVAGEVLREVAPEAASYVAGLTGIPGAQYLAREGAERLTSKEVLGFGAKGKGKGKGKGKKPAGRPLVVPVVPVGVGAGILTAGNGITSAGGGITSAGNGIRTAGSGITSAGGSVGRPDYGKQTAGQRLIKAQAYLHAVAQPTSVDGRGFCSHCS